MRDDADIPVPVIQRLGQRQQRIQQNLGGVRAGLNEALLSGSVDIGAGGIGPLLTIWDKTRTSLGVRAIAALDRSTLILNTNNPTVRTLADFTARDRIAVPAVKVSIQSINLPTTAPCL